MDRCTLCSAPSTDATDPGHFARLFECGSTNSGPPTPLCHERMVRQRLERELKTCQTKLAEYAVVGLDDAVELRAKIHEYEKRMGPLDPIAPHIAKNYIYPEKKVAKQEDGITVPFKVIIVILLVLGIGATWSTYDYAKSTYDMLKSFTSKIIFQPAPR